MLLCKKRTHMPINIQIFQFFFLKKYSRLSFKKLDQPSLQKDKTQPETDTNPKHLKLIRSDPKNITVNTVRPKKVLSSI